MERAMKEKKNREGGKQLADILVPLTVIADHFLDSGH